MAFILNGTDDEREQLKMLCGVPADRERLTVEDVLLALEREGGVPGEPVDLTYLLLEVRRQLRLAPDAPVTLREVREVVSTLTTRLAETVAQAMQRAPSAGHTPDECAQTILALCPVDLQDQMVIARETWSFAGAPLPDAEILASVLIANRQSLHAGDITELQPRTAVQARYGRLAVPSVDTGPAPVTCPALDVVRIQDAELGEQRIEVALCGKSFVPRRRGQRYGCAYCGDVAHAHKIYLLERLEAVKRGQDPRQTVRRPAAFEAGQCTCGVAEGAELLVVEG